MKLKFIIFTLSSLFLQQGFSQETEEIVEEEKPSYWNEHFKFGGYVKYMNTNSFTTLPHNEIKACVLSELGKLSILNQPSMVKVEGSKALLAGMVA